MIRISAVMLIALAACFAQDDGPQVRAVIAAGQVGPVTPPAGGNFFFVHTEMMAGGATVKNAPFSAETSNEHVQTLADGNHIRSTNSGKFYRDTEGRVRREETMALIGPWATQGEAQTHTQITISDPVAHATWELDQEHKTAHRLASPAEEKAGGGIGLSMPPRDVAMLKQKLSAAPGSGNVRTENLGTQMIEGVSAEGTRTTITIPAGAMGNERPIETVSERWYSPELQTVVMNTLHDPRMGDSTYKLVNITRGDPPASLFEVPSDYQVNEGPPTKFFIQKDDTGVK